MSYIILYYNILIYIHSYKYIVLHYLMSKKSVFLNFRTTVKNHKHLKAVQKKYGLPLSDVIHRMISHFADSGDAGDTGDKLLK